jgi:hypothetical protein
MDNLLDQSFKHRLRILKLFARSKGFSYEDSEDFCSYSVVKILERQQAGLTTPSNKNLFIDYLRHLHDNRIKNFKAKHALAHAKLDIDKHINSISSVSLAEANFDSLLCESLKYLKGFYRIVYIMKYIYNWSIKDIGFLTGVSGSNISRTTAIIKRKLIKRQKFEKEFLDEK